MTQIAQMRAQDPRTYAIIGAAMAVHGELGCGFLEAVYHEALGLEFKKREIPFQDEVSLTILYQSQELQTRYVADFVCFEEIIVELKALGQFGGKEESQLLNHLKASGLRVGLLINFGARSLEWKRMVL